jgi:predicted enzyme related to lactoylglutathione lyase
MEFRMTENRDPAFSQIRLLVDDFPAVYRFYRDVVGLAPGSGGETEVYASFHAGTAEVALFRRDLMAEAVGQTIPAPNGSLSPAVLVFEVPDVDAAWERILGADAATLAGPTDRPDWGIRTVQVRDPQGNIVELFVPLEAGQ